MVDIGVFLLLGVRAVFGVVPDDFVDFVDSFDVVLRGVRGDMDFLVPGRGVLGDFGGAANADRGLLTDDAIETLLDPRLGVLGDFGGAGGARCDDCDFIVCCDSASDSSGK